MHEGRLDIPCTRLEDESRETVGKVRCVSCIMLISERETGLRGDHVEVDIWIQL